jgi:hypothetical protein
MDLVDWKSGTGEFEVDCGAEDEEEEAEESAY